MTVARVRSIFVLAVAACLLAVGLPALADGGAGEEAAPDAAAVPALAETVAVSGPIVRWVRGQFRRPSDDQVAAILAEFNRRMIERFQSGEGVLAPAGRARVEVLPNGLHRARVTADQLNVSLVRVAPDGSLVNLCTDSPERARAALSRPAASSWVEE